MKLRIVGLGFAAAGAIALGGVALAQNVPEQFVVSGKAAEQIQDFTTINLATAERIADACEKAAAAEGTHGATGTRTQQEPHESRDPGSDPGISANSARLLSEFRRASHRHQQFKKLPDGSKWNPTPCSVK